MTSLCAWTSTVGKGALACCTPLTIPKPPLPGDAHPQGLANGHCLTLLSPDGLWALNKQNTSGFPLKSFATNKEQILPSDPHPTSSLWVASYISQRLFPFKASLDVGCWLGFKCVHVCTTDPRFWISEGWQGTSALFVSEGDFIENGGRFRVLTSITIDKNTWWDLKVLSHCFPDPWSSVKLLWFQTLLVLKLLFSLYTLEVQKKKKERKRKIQHHAGV